MKETEIWDRDRKEIRERNFTWIFPHSPASLTINGMMNVHIIDVNEATNDRDRFNVTEMKSWIM